jgi:hypothetical protein
MNGERAVVAFEPQAADQTRFACNLSRMRNARIELALTKSLLASGARVGLPVVGALDIVALLGFRRRTGIDDWNRVASGVATFTAESSSCPGKTLDYPRGSVAGGPVPMHFTTGPTYALEDRSLSPYLELTLNSGRAWRRTEVKQFVADVVKKLEQCGGLGVILWGCPQPCVHGNSADTH